MRGEREWATGQPMTQARLMRLSLAHDPFRKVCNFSGSCVDGAFAPERLPPRQERNTENGEIVAVDLLEELGAETFELIGADRAQYLLAGGGEITADKFGAELAHGERRGLGMRPHRLA